MTSEVCEEHLVGTHCSPLPVLDSRLCTVSREDHKQELGLGPSSLFIKARSKPESHKCQESGRAFDPFHQSEPSCNQSRSCREQFSPMLLKTEAFIFIHPSGGNATCQGITDRLQQPDKRLSLWQSPTVSAKAPGAGAACGSRGGTESL